MRKLKKLIIAIFIISIMIVLFGSCRTNHTCPAYHNGSVQNDTPIENTKA